MSSDHCPRSIQFRYVHLHPVHHHPSSIHPSSSSHPPRKPPTPHPTSKTPILKATREEEKEKSGGKEKWTERKEIAKEKGEGKEPVEICLPACHLCCVGRKGGVFSDGPRREQWYAASRSVAVEIQIRCILNSAPLCSFVSTRYSSYLYFRGGGS